MHPDVPPAAPAPGRFIVFEGVEGAGKTTQIQALADWLRQRGRQVLITREPGGSAIGAQIRQILLAPENHRLTTRAELMLYAADRAQHVAEVIGPALASGQDVLCDRYIYSTMAYQGYGRGLDAEAIEWLNDYATAGLRPDLVILLDLDPALGLARARQVGRPDRLEQEALDFHQRVRTGFLALAAADETRFAVIDASVPAQTVSLRLCEQVASRCGIVP